MNAPTMTLEELEAQLMNLPVGAPAIVTPAAVTPTHPATIVVSEVSAIQITAPEPVVPKVVVSEQIAPQQIAPPPAVNESVIQSTGSVIGALVEFVAPAELRADVAFDLNYLDEAIRDHAGRFVHYAGLSARARRQYELTKAITEVAESKLYAIHRESFAAEGKKATEGQIEAAVKQDPRWFSAQQRLIDARAIASLAGDAREAFSQRKDMLVQVSVDRRTEMQGELRIRAAQAAQGDARTAAVNAAYGLDQTNSRAA